MSFSANFHKYIERKSYESLLKQLVAKGLKLENIFDIGAHKGRWTKQHKSLFPNANFYLFEANQEHLSRLQRQSEKCFIGVLSSDGQPAKFYRKAGTGDSLYRENTQHYSVDQFELLQTHTLNQLCKEKQLPPADFIKLDVQGAEIDILKGASYALEKCALVLMECPIVAYNIGAPRFQEYLDFMSQQGFSALRVTEQHSHEGRLLQIDILFLRDTVRQNLFATSAK